HKISQPTLIVHPREDDLADLTNAWHLERHLRGIVNNVVLDDSYHIDTIERQRQLVVERVTAFVARVSARAWEGHAGASGDGLRGCLSCEIQPRQPDNGGSQIVCTFGSGNSELGRR